MKTNKKRHLIFKLSALCLTLALLGCSSYSYKWSTPKEEMEENCKDLNGYGSIIIGKTSVEEAKKQNFGKLFKDIWRNSEDLMILVDSIYRDEDTGSFEYSFPINDEIERMVKYPDNKEARTDINYSEIKNKDLHRLLIMKDRLQYVIIDFYKDVAVSILMQGRYDYMQGLSKYFILKYGEGDGELHEIGDEYGMKRNEFHYRNINLCLDILNENSSTIFGESVHIYDKTLYPKLIALAKKRINERAFVKTAKSNPEDEEGHQVSSSHSESNMYHSKYDGSPQRQFQGSREQEEQLRQMDEMGW